MDLVSVVTEFSQNGLPLTVVLVSLAVFFVTNLGAIQQTYSGYQKGKFTKLEQAIACEHVDDKTRTFLQTELASLHLRNATGLKGSAQVCHALIDLYRKSSGKVGLVHFARSSIYFEIVDGHLVGHLPRWERILYYSKIMLCILCAVTSISLIYILLVTSDFALTLPMILQPILFVIFLWDSAKLVSFRYVDNLVKEQCGEQANAK